MQPISIDRAGGSNPTLSCRSRAFPERRYCTGANLWTMRSRLERTLNKEMPELRQGTAHGPSSTMSRNNLAKKSVDQAVVETANDENTNKTHLVVLVNGLWGKPI